MRTQEFDIRNSSSASSKDETKNEVLKWVIINLNSSAILICFTVIFLLIHNRKLRILSNGIWLALSVRTGGCVFLYVQVMVLYVQPSLCVCVIHMWIRAIGFVMCYGSVLTQLYKNLLEFKSRKAHKVRINLRDLIKWNSLLVLSAGLTLTSWTLIYYEVRPVSDQLFLSANISLCATLWLHCWAQIGELLLNTYCLYLCYQLRHAPLELYEIRLTTLALLSEICISTPFHFIRHFAESYLSTDYTILAYFLRCQLTTTFVVCLLVFPKVVSSQRERTKAKDHPSLRRHSNASSDEMLSSSSRSRKDIDNWDISQMSPSQIKSELSRLYTEVYEYRSQNMSNDNRHLPKKRKVHHRRFSIQAIYQKFTYKDQSSPVSMQPAQHQFDTIAEEDESEYTVLPAVTVFENRELKR